MAGAIVLGLDRFAVTLPIQPQGTPPIGLMVVGEHGADRRMLAIAGGIERIVFAHR